MPPCDASDCRDLAKSPPLSKGVTSGCRKPQGQNARAQILSPSVRVLTPTLGDFRCGPLERIGAGYKFDPTPESCLLFNHRLHWQGGTDSSGRTIAPINEEIQMRKMKAGVSKLSLHRETLLTLDQTLGVLGGVFSGTCLGSGCEECVTLRGSTCVSLTKNNCHAGPPPVEA